nr:MAG TPA: hypothetical protein [Caudoviricetes sp.]
MSNTKSLTQLYFNRVLTEEIICRRIENVYVMEVYTKVLAFEW